MLNLGFVSQTVLSQLFAVGISHPVELSFGSRQDLGVQLSQKWNLLLFDYISKAQTIS